MANFITSGILLLKEKLGPILWQFTPSFCFDATLDESFLKLLPHDTHAAAKVAERRDASMPGREYIRVEEKCPLLHAVEMRNKSFEPPEFIALLRK